MSDPVCGGCRGTKTSGHLLCRSCWFAIDQGERDAVNATYDEARRKRRRGEPLREALLRHRPYVKAALAARKSARQVRTTNGR